MVADDGPGLAEEQLEAVFDPFAVETSRSRQTGGAGLGLTIARALAEKDGARLWLRNRAEGGLEAVVQWPASAQVGGARPRRLSRRAADGDAGAGVWPIICPSPQSPSMSQPVPACMLPARCRALQPHPVAAAAVMGGQGTRGAGERRASGFRRALRQGLLWLLLALALPLAAQEARPAARLRHRRWTSRNGLPHNSLRDIAQTPEGHLWFATWEGLVR